MQGMTPPLDKDKPIPLYIQILNYIREAVATGDWSPGTRLPTEEYLVKTLGVSRVTVRRAISLAVDSHLLIRIPSKGTYVNDITNQKAHSRFIGYVAPSLNNNFNVQQLSGIEDVLVSEGFQLIFCTTGANVLDEDRALDHLETQSIAGYLVLPASGEGEHRSLKTLVTKNYPLVLIDRRIPGIQCDSVTADHYHGGYLVAQYLIQQGFKDIVYLARPLLHLSSVADRYSAYQSAMLDAGLQPKPPFIIEVPGEHVYNRIEEVIYKPEHILIQPIIEWLRGPERPEAVVAMNDQHAILVMEAARYVGIRIPEELGLVGFDNLDVLAKLSPPLTTVHQAQDAIGAEAARLLVRRIHGESSPAQQILLPTHLVVRESARVAV